MAFSVVQGIMPKEGVTFNVVHYNILINTCVKRSIVERAFTTFKMLKNAKLTLSTVTYSSLINTCAKGSNYKQALEVLFSLSFLSFSLSLFFSFSLFF